VSYSYAAIYRISVDVTTVNNVVCCWRNCEGFCALLQAAAFANKNGTSVVSQEKERLAAALFNNGVSCQSHRSFLFCFLPYVLRRRAISVWM